MNSEYEITERTPGVEEFIALRTAVEWGGPSPETAAGGLSGSLMCVCVRKDGELVGFGRVIGDGCFTFYIHDVIVHPDHQRKGIGKAVMDRIMSYIDSVGRDDSYVGLGAARGAIRFYEPYGFKARPPDAPGMQLWLKHRRAGLSVES